MKTKLDEKGYALLLVMMLVVLFTILGMGLLTMNINASKQFNLKEEQVQARHQAEMGVLHYQQAIKMYVAANQPLANKEIEFCKTITPSRVESDSAEKKYMTILLDEKCSMEDGQIVISVLSNGTAGQKGDESIEAKLYMNNASSVPLEPVPLEGEEVLNIINIIKDVGNSLINGCLLDCNIFEEFTDVRSLTLKTENVLFKNHLLVDILTVDGGTGQQLIVEKDLYIRDKLEITNFACFAVQGNFSLLEEGIIGNKTYMYVYGNINLPEAPVFQNNNGNIFVNGDVYINGVKTVSRPDWAKPFPEHPHEDANGCELPGKGNINPNPWKLSDRIEAIYK